MTKSKYSASPIVFAMHLVHGAQFVNADVLSKLLDVL